ncbi:hypothetical protein KIW84_054943 [Lathyrus oleraceus]|uniref:NADH dehydrogenase [ubiquinone] 1 alpha subcomplex subunit 12 n=1 Tax=Pisum sativum TaxID=3888 RepID=A0A9D5AI25_PEA|nr:hypothetical protein KIW84_054943 [Pisum sativum]
MRRVFGKIAGLFSNRTAAGVDKTGNKYFTRNEEIDGIMKEKRWVVFKGEQDPTSIPVEWICWLNGQRKRAPTPEEQIELDARREQVKQNVARIIANLYFRAENVGGPDLKSFIRQLQVPSEGNEVEESPGTKNDKNNLRKLLSKQSSLYSCYSILVSLPWNRGFSFLYKLGSFCRNSQDKTTKNPKDELESSEPTGSGASYRPGTWQPPF